MQPGPWHQEKRLPLSANSSCGRRKLWRAKHAPGGQRAVEAAECQPAVASRRWIRGNRVSPVCHSSQNISQALLGLTETTRFKKQQQLPGRNSIPDPLNMQGPRGQVLCRDMLSKICEQQPAAPERTVGARPTKGVHRPEA